MKKYVDFLFKIDNEESENCGEEFFVEVEDKGTMQTVTEAIRIATENWPEDWPKIIGVFTPEDAEFIGLDTH